MATGTMTMDDLLQMGTQKIERLQKAICVVYSALDETKAAEVMDVLTPDEWQEIQEALDKEAEGEELMLVQVELAWGMKWAGSHYTETKGEGVTARVMEHHSNREKGYSFSGCPLGRVYEGYTDDAAAIEAAIQDFIRYGKPEYKGKRTLCREMIRVVQTTDFRKS